MLGYDGKRRCQGGPKTDDFGERRSLTRTDYDVILFLLQKVGHRTEREVGDPYLKIGMCHHIPFHRFRTRLDTKIIMQLLTLRDTPSPRRVSLYWLKSIIKFVAKWLDNIRMCGVPGLRILCSSTRFTREECSRCVG